jgi:capsular polysaccharide biosynthesis protein
VSETSSAREALAYRPTTVADYLAILRRRKWIVIVLPIVAAISAYAVSQTQSPLYRATAEILVNRSSVVSAITQISDPALGDPTRFLTTEADIARSPELAAQVPSAAGLPRVTGDQLLGSSKVTPQTDADLLNISVSWPNVPDAVRLANAYAIEFTRYKTKLDTERINAALVTLRARIALRLARGRTFAAPVAGCKTLVLLARSVPTVSSWD